MGFIAGINSSMRLAAQAMQTHSTGLQITAHNIANVSTDEFIPQRALYATGPGGQGVMLDAIARDESLQGNSATNSSIEGEPAENGVTPVKPSGTEIAKDIVSMIATQRAYEANAQTIRTTDEIYDTILSIKA